MTNAFRKRFENRSLVLARYRRIDLDGEKYAPDLFRSLRTHHDLLLKAIRRLSDLGYSDIFIFTDHGFIVFPEKEAGNVTPKPDGSWILNKDRVLAGSGSESPDTVRFSGADLGIGGDIEHFVFPRTLATFTDGVRYFHGGLSVQECILPALHVRVATERETKSEWSLRLSYRGKDSGIVTTRLPMIEIAAFSDDMFQQEIALNLSAMDDSGNAVGAAASSGYTDKNTGHVVVRAGQAAKTPLRLDDEFSGKVTILAKDPNTGKVMGNKVVLETRIRD